MPAMKIVPLALAAAVVGCAAAPPCTEKAAPLPPAGPAADAKECNGPPPGFGGYESRPSVVRYPAGAADTLRVPDRTIVGPRTLLCWPGPIAIGPGGELYVLNRTQRQMGRDSVARPGWETWVTVYDSAAQGDAAPVRVLGTAIHGFRGGASLAVDRSGYVYMGSELSALGDSGSISVFERDADGDVEPVRVLAGNRTGLRWPGELTVDRHGNVYVLNGERERENAVRVWGPGAEGNLAPCRLIAGDRTGLARPAALAVDSEDRLYVANSDTPVSGGVTVYDAWANGNASPRRTVSAGAINDAMRAPERVAIGRRDSLYVRSASNLSVFATDPLDTDKPSRTFFSRAPELFALDRHDTVYALSGSAIVVYPPGYSGGRTEVRRLTVQGTDLRDVSDMEVDSRGSLYLASKSVIRVIAPGAAGEVTPSRTIAGSRTRLHEVRGIALDRAGRLYVSNGPRSGGAVAIQVYAPGAKGDDEPVRVLGGANTGLARAGVMAFDGSGDLYVTDITWENPGIVRVFHSGAQGDVAPERVLMGPETLLRNPGSVAFGPGDTMYVLNVFGYLGGHRCPYGAANATVTVYPPEASGNLDPLRSVVLVKNGRLAPGMPAYIMPRGIAVDVSGALHVWHTGGSLRYAPGAGGFVPAVATFKETRGEDVVGRGVAVSGAGVSWQTEVVYRRLIC